MKLTTLLMTLVLSTSAAFAGTYSSKNAKGPVLPPPAPTCGCFGPGWSVDAFGGVLFNREGKDTAGGGGVGLNYFFNRNLGIDVSYGVYDTHSQTHAFDGNLVLRFPIDSLCIAPYILAGGGYDTNGTSGGQYDAGGGIDIRFSPTSCIGLFAEGSYHWATSGGDYTGVRMGLRFPF
jgi:hypothetical protein